MDLYHHFEPAFTRWIIERNLLHEPFVAIDVGVQGGEHARWDFLGDQVRVFGFDAIWEAVEKLKERGDRPHRRYRTLALGNEDGERQFYVPANAFSASFYDAGTPMHNAKFGDGALGPRTVEIRRLDTLFADGEIPAADYVKTDCEGFDAEVLRGARTYLAKSNILCVTVETNFGISPVYPRTPFAEISDIAIQHRLLVFDLNCVRYQRPAYVAARTKHPWPVANPLTEHPYLDVGQPGTFDFLFCRDFVAEDLYPGLYADWPGAITAPTVDKLIKAMINFELHGLMDCAVDLAEHFRACLAERLDVDETVRLLTRRPPYARNTADVVECLRMVGALRTQLATERARMTSMQADFASIGFLLRRWVQELGKRARHWLTQS